MKSDFILISIFVCVYFSVEYASITNILTLNQKHFMLCRKKIKETQKSVILKVNFA